MFKFFFFPCITRRSRGLLTRPRVKLLPALSLSAALLAACGGGGTFFFSISFGGGPGVDPQPSSQPQFRFLNATPGAGSLDAQVDGKAAASSIGFGQVSAWAQFDAGARSLSLFPSGSTTARAGASFTAINGHHLSAFSYYPTTAYANASPTSNPLTLPLSAFVLDDPYSDGVLSAQSSSSATQTRARFVNVACQSSSVDAYLLPAGSTIATAQPTFAAVGCATASPVSGQNSLALAAGSYELIITTAGSKVALYDSSPNAATAPAIATGASSPAASGGISTAATPSVTLAAGTDYVIAIAPAQQPGASGNPLTAILATSGQSSATTIPNEAAISASTTASQ